MNRCVKFTKLVDHYQRASEHKDKYYVEGTLYYMLKNIECTILAYRIILTSFFWR